MKKLSFLFLLLLIFAITGCGNTNLEKIFLNTSKLVPVNGSQIVNVEFVPEKAKEEVSWSSSNENIASIENGVINGIAEGEVTITATTSSGIKNTINVVVYKKADSIKLDASNLEMYVNDSRTITATITPENATYKNITWSSSNSNVATVVNGIITGINSGTAIISATTEDGTTKRCTIIVKDKPIEYSGYGNKVISEINVPKGVYKIILNNQGISNFIVKFYNDNISSYGDLLVNEIGNYSGSVILRDGLVTQTTNGMLEIKSSGNWSVKIEPLSENISKSLNGAGDTVNGMFYGNSKRNIATINNYGSSNFIVKIYDEYGNNDLLVNEIGSYNGQSLFVTSLNTKYYFSVISDGTWSINWE